MRRRASIRRVSAVWLAIAVTVGACGGGEAAATTTTPAPLAVPPRPLVLGESEAPPGMEFVTSFSWQQLRADLDELLPGGVIEELESLGLVDASASVFLSPASSDTGEVDLAAGEILGVSAALTFGDGAGAGSALEVIRGAAIVYTGAFDATPNPFDVAGVAEGAIGLVVNHPSFPGGAAAVAWVEGSVMRISFAQGGEPTREARTLAEAMTEMEP